MQTGELRFRRPFGTMAPRAAIRDEMGLTMLSDLLTNPLLVLLAILTAGYVFGRLSIRGISLGTAGVLFVALVAGHFGLRVPKEVMDLGLLFFAYTVGLQAGPRFFRTFRREGVQALVVGLGTVGLAAVAAVGVAWAMGLSFDLASGLYAGALTCTPALAAAVEVVERVAPGQAMAPSVGYGLAYPLGEVSVILLVQLLPRLLRRDLRAEEKRWQEEQAVETPPLEVKQFRVTNPNCDGKTLREINPGRMSQANVSRVRHQDRILPATPEVTLHLDDVVMAVGPAAELDKLRLVLGEETQVPMESGTSVIAQEVVVTEGSWAGKRLAELHVRERYGVVITRLRRQGLELTPTGGMTLEVGDSLSVVGERAAVEEFAHRVGGERRRLEETRFVPFFLGLLLGVAVGVIPIALPNGLTIRLGPAGGAFLVSLGLGHFGRIGPLRLYMPSAARQFARELGLMLFLAGAGTNAGAQLVGVLQQQGWQLVLGGAVITFTAIGVGLVLTLVVYRMPLLAALGGLCAAMTNPPALSATAAQAETDMPTLAYAGVYPVGLIFKIVLAQVLVEVLRAVL